MNEDTEKEIQRMISDPLRARQCIDLYLTGRRNMQEEIARKLKGFEMDKAVQIALSVPVDYLENEK